MPTFSFIYVNWGVGKHKDKNTKGNDVHKIRSKSNLSKMEKEMVMLVHCIKRIHKITHKSRSPNIDRKY